MYFLCTLSSFTGSSAVITTQQVAGLETLAVVSFDARLQGLWLWLQNLY